MGKKGILCIIGRGHMQPECNVAQSLTHREQRVAFPSHSTGGTLQESVMYTNS